MKRRLMGQLCIERDHSGGNIRYLAETGRSLNLAFESGCSQKRSSGTPIHFPRDRQVVKDYIGMYDEYVDKTNRTGNTFFWLLDGFHLERRGAKIIQ